MLLGSLAAGHALAVDELAGFRIEAKTVVLEDQTSLIRYQGQVHMRQSQHELWADELVVRRDASGAITSLDAVGHPVRFRYQERPEDPKQSPEPGHWFSGEAPRLHYQAHQQRLELSVPGKGPRSVPSAPTSDLYEQSSPSRQGPQVCIIWPIQKGTP